MHGFQIDPDVPVVCRTANGAIKVVSLLISGSRLRNLVFYLARQRSGLTLQEIGTRTDFDYKLVGNAAGNHSVLIRKDKALRALSDRCMAALAKSET